MVLHPGLTLSYTMIMFTSFCPLLHELRKPCQRVDELQGHNKNDAQRGRMEAFCLQRTC